MLRKLCGEAWDVTPGTRDVLIEPPAVLAERVLHRLQQRERAAEINRRPSAVVDYRLAWAYFYELHFGRDDSYRRFYGPPVITPEMRAEAGKRERAYQEKRPLREVVKRAEHVEMNPASGRHFTVYSETLSCGHVLPERVSYFAEQPAKHRRCGECAIAAAAAEFPKVKRARA